MRHARTTANNGDVFLSTTESQVTEAGLEQARMAAEWLSTREIDTIVTSPATRCVDTAEILQDYLNIPVRVCRELCERSVHRRYEGVPSEQLVHLRISEGHRFVDPTQDWNDVLEVESDRDVYMRIMRVLREYRNLSTLVVTHAGVIKSFLHCEFHIDAQRSNCFKVGNSSILTLDEDANSHYQLYDFRRFDR